MVRLAHNLTDTARDSAVAKIAILDEIYNASGGSAVNRAVKKIEELSRTGQLPEKLRELARLANAKVGKKEHLLTFRTLRRWIANDKPGALLSERIVLHAPRVAGPNYTLRDDVAAVLRLYRQPNKPSMMWCAQKISREIGGDWKTLYDAARRFKEKVPATVFHGGRNSAAALKALQPFRRREFLSLAPNEVWTGDGHAMKFKVAHPETGAPFVPEVTVIMDVSSRYIVGWSVSYSESCIAVSDALRHAVQTHGVPLIYYSDNGGGQKNKTFDAPVTGILGALNIRHETGIPGNPQGRGVIERSWQTVTIALAKQFATYHGHGADRDTLKKVNRDITRALRATTKGEVTTLPRRLPSFAEFIASLQQTIQDYNTHHEHRSLPKLDGKHHATPAAWRSHRLEETGTDIAMLAPQEVATLFMPAALRKAKRGEVRFLNCTYFHKDLMLVDDEVVKVHYDIHDVSRVWVKKLSGELIAEAILDGNKVGYFPQSMIEVQREKRADRRVALKQSQIDAINLERTPPALIDQSTGAALVPLVFDREPELVPALMQQSSGRPMFDTDPEKYRWLQMSGTELTLDDERWLAEYKRTSEYRDLFGDGDEENGGENFLEAAAR